MVRLGVGVGREITTSVAIPVRALMTRTYGLVYRLTGPEGVFARTWSTGLIAFWAVVVLCSFLLLYYFGR